MSGRMLWDLWRLSNNLAVVQLQPMKPSLNKLHKFFKLEVERNYHNKAVVGGLERMLEPWRAEANSDGLPPELIEAVVIRLRDYTKLTPNSRAEVLEGVWRRIQREAGERLPPLVAAPPPEAGFDRREGKPARSPAPSPRAPA